MASSTGFSSQEVLVKCADDLTLSIPFGDGYPHGEVQSAADWAESIRRVCNLDEIWEIVLSGMSSQPVPGAIQG